MNFYQKLQGAIERNQSLLVVGLDPNPEMLPTGQKGSIADLENWLERIISATADLVCIYKPTLGFYEVLGTSGLELLTRILAKIPPSIPILLDAKHGDLNTATLFARMIFEQWNVDAVTLSPYAGQDHVAPFLVYPDRGAFILCHTSNPGAMNLQEYPDFENPHYLQVVRESRNWGTPEQVFFEVGTTQPEVLRKIRKVAPERWILLRSLWEDRSQFNELIKAGLTPQGEGLLVPLPQDILKETDLSRRTQSLRDEINTIRAEKNQANECEIWSPNVCLLKQHPHQDLILQLFDIGCLMFGEYVQASGETFSYYIDLRRIISNPQVFARVIQAYGEILKNLTFDRIAGIPYGSLPTATGLSLLLHHPMIFPRKEVKAHGTRRLIEGNFQAGETVVVVDDILISGNSAIEGAEKLESAGLQVKDIVVLIDHGKGVKERLRHRGYQAYSVLNLGEITETLYEAGRLTEEQYACFVERSS